MLHDAADDDRAGRIRDRIDVELHRVLEKLVDEDRVAGGRGNRSHHVAIQRRHVIHDRHRAAAENVRRAHDEREPDLRRDLARLVGRGRRPARRLRDAKIPQQLRKPLAVFRQIDRIRRGPENPDARMLQRQRQLQGRLPAVLHHAGHVAAGFLLARDDRRHILERQRLEIQTIDRVVIG